jgi:hypothetical protein
MAQPFDPGASQFTFTGDRTHIVYLTVRPGPIIEGQDFSGGQLNYQGPETNRTFYGKDIALENSPLGTLLTVTLKFRDDTGGITLTLLIPQIHLNGGPLTFETLALKTSSRGFILGPGPELTYTVLPLLAVASKVLESL